MSGSYHPKITEGIHPTDGGWTSDVGGHSILLLSLPEFTGFVGCSFDSFDYMWLYDRDLKAYIFCFRLSDGAENAVLFQREHAGILLTDTSAYEPFHMAVTNHALDEVNDETDLFFLPNIQLQRSPVAGW